MNNAPRFRELLDADLITVTTNMNIEQARVENPGAIARLVEWLGGLEDDWSVPPDGVRIAKIRLNFSADGRSLGNIGVGRTFLAAHRHGGFRQHPIDESQGARIFELLDMDDPRP